MAEKAFGVILGDREERREGGPVVSAEIARLAGRYWRSVCAIVAAFALIGAAAAALLPSSYEVTGKVIVLNKRLSGPNGEGTAEGLARYESPRAEDLFTETEILRSMDVVIATIESLRRSYRERGEPLPKPLVMEDPTAGITPLAEAALDALTTLVVPGAYVVNVAYEAEDPVFAQRFVATHLQSYEAARQALWRDEEAATFFESARGFYAERLRGLEADLAALRERTPMGDLLREKELRYRELEAASQGLTSARDEETALRERAEALEAAARAFESDPEAGPVFLPPEVMNDALVEAQSRLAAALETALVARTTYREGSRNREAAWARYEQQRRPYLELLAGQVRGFRAEAERAGRLVEMREQRINALSERQTELETLIAEQDRLLNQREATLRSFLETSNRRDAVEAADATGPRGFSNVRILQPATVPSSPTSLSAAIQVAAATALGCLVAAGYVYWRELNSPFIGSMAEAEAILFPGRTGAKSEAA